MFIVNELQNIIPYSLNMEIPQVWMMQDICGAQIFFFFFSFGLMVRGVRVRLRASRKFPSQSGQRQAVHSGTRGFT